MTTSAVDALRTRDSDARADAQRNLARLVAAAREAVNEVGLNVTAHEIARRAGVGVGTLYRRVGTREALLEAVSRELIDQIVQLAERSLTIDDPWQAFTRFAEEYVQVRVASCGVNEALGGADTLDLDEPLTAIRAALQRLVERAQTSGQLRADVGWRDLPFLLAGVMVQSRSVGLTARPDQWRTNLTVLLDGLRAEPGRASAGEAPGRRR